MGKMKVVTSKHKMPKNLTVIAVPKEASTAAGAARALRERVARDNAGAAKWLKNEMFGDRIYRVPVNGQAPKRLGVSAAMPRQPFAVPVGPGRAGGHKPIQATANKGKGKKGKHNGKGQRK